ncbi:MAG: hypothetical protein R2883_08830, partial [Caldisericia bacterium]
SKNELKEIVSLQIDQLSKKLHERKIQLEITDDAKLLLAELGYSVVYGARPLKRVIQNRIENPLSEMILRGEIGSGDTISVSEEDGNFQFDCGG